MWGRRNNEQKLILWENLVFFFHIENVSFLTFFNVENFLSLTLQSLQNPYYLVLINPIFDELSFGIKFIIYYSLE